MDNPDKLAT